MKKILILIIIILFFIPILAVAVDPPDPEDPSFDYDRTVFGNNRAIIEIAYGEEGMGLYLAFECDVELNMHIINSTAYDAILNMQPWDSVNNLNLLYRLDGAMKFILPYDDTFYVLFVNNQMDDSELVGWYACDETGPQMEVFGMIDGQKFEYTDEIEVTCYFEDRYWNLTKMELFYRGIYDVDSMAVNQKLYNWSVWIDFSNYDDSYPIFVFRGTDTFGNTRDVTIQVEIINGPVTTTDPVDPPGGVLLVMFGFFGVCGILGIISAVKTYRSEGIEGLRPKIQEKKRKR